MKAALFAARNLPLALLLAALASVFAFAGDRDSFYRSRAHNWNSTKNMALAENLSPAHNFRLFLWRSPDESGEPAYEMYSRFPVGGPALIKLAAMPFGDDLAAKLFAARLLMLAMFAGAALFAYLALARALGSRWIALAATLFALSSFWTLYYADEISNESVMDMFALALAFHGMAVFWDERRFGQLLAKSCAALLIGWHIYALLLPFIAMGLWMESAAALRSAPDGWRRFALGLPKAALAAARSRYAVLGAASLLVGIALLAFNFWNEYTAFGGEIPFRELPSVSSVITRTGGDDSGYGEYELDRLAWDRFIGEQLYRVGVAVLPYALPFARDLGQTDYAPLQRPLALIALGFAATATAFGCVLFARGRRRRALAVLAAFGFVWAIPMRHNTAFLEFESVFFLGVPMVLAAAALAGARRLSLARFPRAGERAVVAAALICAAAFAASAFEMSRFERDPQAAEFRAALMADFSEMRPAVQGASVFVPAFLRRYSEFDGHELTYTASYALAGGVLAWEDEPHLRAYPADYAISRYRDEIPALKTPDNSALHLYDGAMTNIADLRLLGCPDAEYGPAVACDNFAVHLEADRLTYIKDQCEPLDAESRFELSVFPQNAADLPPEFSELGHESLNFEFPKDELSPDIGGCAFQRKLPRYPIDRLGLSQWTTGDGPIWARTVENAAALMATACPDNEHGTAIACTDYAVYLKGSELTYINDRCAPKHREGRFMLSVFPQDPADIRGQDGDLTHQSMNFDFPADGRTPGGGCLFHVAIPDYPIERVITGQWIKGEGGFGVWEAWADDIERRRTAACENARYGTAIVCENFAVYIDGDTLTYAKDRCSAADAESRFLLSVFPHDADDIPPSSRDGGHANMNFDFPADAMTAGGGCVFRRELPKYPIDYIAIGQWSPSGAYSSDWRREARGIDRLRTLACENPRYGAAAACGDYYDIYLSGGTLTMLSEECSPERARERFFLSVFPEDPANVPQERRERGLNHASMNFDFPQYGVLANGECLITVPLPDYPIAAIETGRADADGGGEWRAKIAVPK